VSLDATIAANLRAVRERMARAAERSGRAPAAVRLVAVSKTFGPDHVRAAAAAGQREFGENKVQEALQKIGALADMEIGWHLIGHLQSNKARKAAGAFAWIQSVDSADLLERLDRAAVEEGTAPDLLVQVDLAGEATKHGAPPQEVRTILEAAGRCAAVKVRGLMLLPPWSDDAEATRPYFVRLRELRDALAAETGHPERLAELSMGMSHDFEVAVEEGATIVRVGTAIFGRRS
jgi:pyridoxal phosphate enzyme (YggS family)